MRFGAFSAAGARLFRSIVAAALRTHQSQLPGASHMRGHTPLIGFFRPRPPKPKPATWFISTVVAPGSASATYHTSVSKLTRSTSRPGPIGAGRESSLRESGNARSSLSTEPQARKSRQSERGGEWPVPPSPLATRLHVGSPGGPIIYNGRSNGAVTIYEAIRLSIRVALRQIETDVQPNIAEDCFPATGTDSRVTRRRLHDKEPYRR